MERVDPPGGAPTGGAFAAALAAGRDAFNARFEAARRQGLQPEAALETLDRYVRPVVEAVAPERAAAVLDGLYDLALDATATGALGDGARAPAVAEGWRTVLTALPAHVAVAPGRVGAAVLHALQTLDGGGVDPAPWAARMAALGAEAPDVPALLDLGAVLAWTGGLAAYRTAALDAVPRLVPSLAARALGLPDGVDVAAALARFRDGVWTRPADVGAQGPPVALQVVAVCGGFQGFGGPFALPPAVRVWGGRLVADDGLTRHVVLADAFGSAFRRVPDDVPTEADAGGTPAFTIDAGGTVRHGSAMQAFPELAGWSSAAATADTLAVALPDSHRLVLVGRSSAGPGERPWRRA